MKDFSKFGGMLAAAFFFMGADAFGQAKNDSISEKAIDEVVVVGYKTQKRNTTTESYSRIGSEDLKSVTTPNVSSMIQGRAAGVNVVQSSGAPGSQGNIIVRGLSSFNGNSSPLWVIDGVIYNGTPFIDPNQIESINILKDAASTALYGSRGAAGVVQVTTKAGSKGIGKINVSINNTYAFFNTGNFKLMNGAQMYDFYQNDMKYTSADFLPQLRNRDFNWLNNGTEVGTVQNYTLDFSGGTEKTKTFISGNFYRETGTVKGSILNRYSFRVNHEYQVRPRLTLKPKLSVVYNENDSRGHSLSEMYLNMPWDNPYLANGLPANPRVHFPSSGVNKWWGRDVSNYLYDLQWNYRKSSNFNVFINGDFDYKITDNLTFASINNYTIYSDESMSYTDPLSIGGTATGGQIARGAAKRVSRYFNQMLRYNFKLGENHNFNALAAYEYQDTDVNSFGASVYNIVGGKEVLDVGAESGTKPYGSRTQTAYQGGLFNLGYDYNDKYLAQVSVRRDGSSVFGKDSKYGTFYSVSAGWNLHKEDFLQKSWLNQLKLRGSYGTIGNTPSGNYSWQDLYALGYISGNSTISYIYNGAMGAVWSQMGNPNYSWEVVNTVDFGLDVRLFNRLGINVDVYQKHNKDMSFVYYYPVLAGQVYQWQNIGDVRNRGIELALNYDVIKNRNVKWTVDFNIATNQNRITKLRNAQPVPNGNMRLFEGMDMNTWFMRQWAGVDPQTGNPLWVVENEDGTRTTTTNYNAATLLKSGSSTPKYFGGFNSRLEVKGVYLDVNATFSKGGLIYNSARELFDSDGAYPTYNQMDLGHQDWTRWQKPGDIATHPRAAHNNQSLSNKTSTRYLEDGSFLKIRSIKLGYNLPKTILSPFNISNASIYVNAENMFVFTKFSFVDPEVGGYSASATQYPIPRRLTLGLNLTF